MEPITLSRRTFLAFSAIVPFVWRAGASTPIPMGIEMYSVREELKKDPQGTVRAIAAMGYQGLEFYAPYFEWTPIQAKEMKKLLDDLGIRCFSTHNDASYMTAEKIQNAIDLNSYLGSKFVVMASSQPKPGLDGWKAFADQLNFAAEKLERAGLKAGYHNHQLEFRPLDGVRPMEVLAKNTKPTVMLQLDVGTCLEAGSDPVAWIRANPGRIRSLHCKDWSPEPGKGYSVLFGEGVANWKEIFAAAQSVGGAEYYLMEQEGSRYSELETAKRCLQAYRSSASAIVPVPSQKRKTTMSQQGRILGIGGIFFKSANRQQMQEWYAKHLGLADSGHGVMLPWREKDHPESEQMTIWSIFPGNTTYFAPSPASFMVNYIVDDLDALLDRLAKEGVRIDPKRQDESYGRFAWIYDPDGNKIELWQPLHPDK